MGKNHQNLKTKNTDNTKKFHTIAGVAKGFDDNTTCKSTPLSKIDPWLKPYQKTIDQRQKYIQQKVKKTLGENSVINFAAGFQHFGLHLVDDEWVFREWAPNAQRIFLVGEFNDWTESDEFSLTKQDHGQWIIKLPKSKLHHLQKYKLKIYWKWGSGWRLPSYATVVVQSQDTTDFSAVIWSPPKRYQFKHATPKNPATPLIYEAHIGMSSEEERVATFQEFSKNILPRIKKAGYNTVQLMAIQEHPYYGSFGYHVANFFAVSSRFGTPDDFKKLVDKAHSLNLKVIIDIVHSHAVKNSVEGLGLFDGTPTQYFRGDHPAWDSKIFDYGKSEVLHFLLSNCRWWLEEYNIDGFRFDGVTSMIYTDHGLEKAFTSYDDYYKYDNIDKDALVYLQLANQLTHEFRPETITIAEEMSGFPALAAPINQQGIGFDYRLAMGIPDLWIKTIKEEQDENWDLAKLFYELTSHRPEEKVISYAESHDQALVGDKTLIFRLIDQAIYWHMQKDDANLEVERGVALHKMIRLLTASTNGGGYLNFMGNEFGHPEWIDFPREGNNWSFKYAKRQWNLVDDKNLKYQFLANFDRTLMELLPNLTDEKFHYINIHQADHILSFVRNDLLFIFNFSPQTSHNHYKIPTFDGSYKLLFSSDDASFGGQNRLDQTTKYFTKNQKISVYIPARVALVLQKND